MGGVCSFTSPTPSPMAWGWPGDKQREAALALRLPEVGSCPLGRPGPS